MKNLMPNRFKKVPDSSEKDKSTKTAEIKFFNSEELQDKIRIKAYELYKQRGESNGSDQDDWFQAERIIVSGRY
ncbi:MAG: DUF2934 domain-containing protein [Candidatus Omnitrophota bacterium]|nr:DUF2934 domain-containing protein [Candidatus Omnitrophota bacterium]